eukprot:gene1183-32523_t
MAMERQIVGASNISDELSVAQIEKNELSAAQMQRKKSQQWQSRDRNGNGKRPAFPPPPHANMKREKQTHLSWVTAKGWTGPNNRPHTQETIDRANANDLCFRCGTKRVYGRGFPQMPTWGQTQIGGPPLPCPPPLEILTANAACLLAPEDSAHFSARLSGCEGRVLIDSGACSVFVNQKYLIANGIATFEGTPVKVRVADGSLAITNLRCDFVLDLGQHRSRVRAYVLPDLGSDDTAALLGRSWMKQGAWLGMRVLR